MVKGIDLFDNSVQFKFKKLLVKSGDLYYEEIFIGMEKKTRPISLRLKESQVRWLTEILIEERRTKSEILRDALNRYLVENIRRNELPENNFKKPRRNE